MPLKVIIYPAFANNPYTTLLAQGLEGLGFQVIPVPMHRFVHLGSTVKQNGLPDVVHFQWQHHFFLSQYWPLAILKTVIFFVQLFVLRLLKVRVVWTVHNITNHEHLFVRWEMAASRLLARMAHHIIVHCSTAQKEVSAAYGIPPEKISVIPLGSYADWYADFPALSKQIAQDELGLEKGNIVFLFFGMIRAYKGVDILLDAFYQLEDPRARLIIIGQVFSNDFLAELVDKAKKDRRVFTRFEFVSDELLSAYICSCDYVVLPYRHSLTSSASSLAAVYSRPVIVPRFGCWKELPEDSALLYHPEEKNGLYDCLCRALKTAPEEMGQVAHQHDAQFQWPDIARRTAQHYQ